MAMKCPKCGSENADYVIYCGQCASALKEADGRADTAVESTTIGTDVNLESDENAIIMVHANFNVTVGPSERRGWMDFLLHGSNEEGWGFGGYMLVTNKRLILTREKLSLRRNDVSFRTFDLEDVTSCAVTRFMFSDMLMISLSCEGLRYTITCDHMSRADPRSLMRLSRLEPDVAQATINETIAHKRARQS